MPIQIQQDLCALDFQQREIEIPISAVDRSLGCVHVTVKELPYAIKKSVELRFLAASQEIDKARESFDLLSKGDAVSSAKIDEIGLALGNLRSAQLEVIRWGVAGHRSDDFLHGATSIPFEGDKAILAGVAFDVASLRMLRLYSLIATPSLSSARSDFVSVLCNAVLDFQRGVVTSPEEIWTSAEKKSLASQPEINESQSTSA